MHSKFVKTLVFTTAISFAVGSVSYPVSAVGLNRSCKKAGLTTTATSKGKTVEVKCTKVGKKLRWVQVQNTITAPVVTNAPVVTGTISQRNAVSKGASYLKYSSFSRSSLIKQLEYEGFSNADAAFAADAQNADWNAQAAKKAESYLKSSSFSRSGLIKQLVYEGFTDAQAEYGVATGNTDWNAQAAKKAESYLKSSSFSRSGLIKQLVYEGFTDAQAEYGVSTTGL